LGAAESGVVAAGCGGGGEDSAVGIDVGECDSDTIEPSQRFECDGAGVAHDDESVQAVPDLRVAAFAALESDSVSDQESAAFYAYGDAVAVDDTHPVTVSAIRKRAFEGQTAVDVR
jgi:hypothetical protein